MGNSRRYEDLSDKLDIENTVFTSNIKNLPENAVVVNYSDLISSSIDASDSSGVMLLKLLKKSSVTSVALAGYDGFSKNPLENYYSSKLSGIFDQISLQEKNLAIKTELEELSSKIKMTFVTPSIYSDEGKKENH